MKWSTNGITFRAALESLLSSENHILKFVDYTLKFVFPTVDSKSKRLEAVQLSASGHNTQTKDQIVLQQANVTFCAW